jgi:CheY-like chemotaxis protein
MKILIVDDEPVNIGVLANALKGRTFTRSRQTDYESENTR